MTRFDDYFNYHECKFTKLHFVFDSLECDNYLLFGESTLYDSKNREIINYSDIEKVDFSLSSRIYNPTVVSSNPLEIIKKRWTKGIIGTSNKGVHMIYSLDLTVITNDQKYYFESYSLNKALDIINHFINLNIPIIDPLEIYSILKINNNSDQLQKYMDNNFTKLAKKYHLDNPRGIVYNV